MTHHVRTRWHLLDILRGFTLINMILYHFLYDVFIVYGVIPDWIRKTGTFIWQQWICSTFIIIAGIAFHFSRSHLKHGIQLNFWGAVVTIVTLVCMPDETILFGILTFTGSAILITWLAEPLLKKVPATLGIIISLIGFLLTEEISAGYLGCYGYRLAELPGFLYQTFAGAWLGFPPSGFYSSDYFSIFPWIFVFWIGYYLFYFLKKERVSSILMKNPIPPLAMLGTHTLWVYLIHQPVCMGICMIIFK